MPRVMTALVLLALTCPAPLLGREPESRLPPNLLVDVSARLIDAAVRKDVDRTEPTAEIIMDAPVTGRSRTQGQVRAELIPDPCRVAVDIVFGGVVQSCTVSERSLALLYTTTTTPLEVRRRVLLDSTGFYSVPAGWHAKSTTVLDQATDRNGNPDALTAKAARLGFCLSKNQSEEETAAKTAARAAERQAAELSEALARANQAVAEGVQAARRAGLAVKGLHFETTPAAVHAHLRVDTVETIAAPPALPADADLGLRLHQSLVNEAARKAVGGKTYRLDEMQAAIDKLTDRFLRDDTSPATRAEALKALQKLLAAVTGKPATLTFAADDPVAVRFAGAGFTVEVHLASVRLDGTAFKDVRLRAAYRLETAGAGARAVRQGPVEVVPSAEAPPAAVRLILETLAGGTLREHLAAADLTLPVDGMRLEGPRVGAGNGWLALAWTLRKQPTVRAASRSTP